MIFQSMLKDFRVIVVAGLAKNTGKTTSLNRLIREARASFGPLGIVSTGRDGERADVFTGLEKPAIVVPKGTCFSTTEACVDAHETDVSVVRKTAYQTSMGHVLIARAEQAGPVEVAGPVTVQETIDLIDTMRTDYQVRTMLVDGSINRMAIITSRLNAGIVLATGASLGSMQEALEQTRHRVAMLRVPPVNEKTRKLLTGHGAPVIAVKQDRSLSIFSVPLLDDISGISETIEKNVAYLYTNGAMVDPVIESLLNKKKAPTLVVEDASKIQITQKAYQSWRSGGGKIGVMNPVQLVCVTCNPHNPTGEGFNAPIFLNRMRKTLDVPVIDVEWEKA